MHIEKARPDQIDAILGIYDTARAFMRKSGNMNQWINGYPQRELIEDDIRRGWCHICREGEEILGVFAFLPGEDPTYREIWDGAWPDEEPYHVIHRIASCVYGRGVARFCFDYCKAHADSLRIDTHEDNIPMQRALAANGFVRCGIIRLENGDPRIAYQFSAK
ncbi:MAG: GNAT family N-acetyltransferase [Christensenellaceae bacterium]|nr:GNAT family N-acetyltransferase [Christensenellaceae bacterium]